MCALLLSTSHSEFFVVCPELILAHSTERVSPPPQLLSKNNTHSPCISFRFQSPVRVCVCVYSVNFSSRGIVCFSVCFSVFEMWCRRAAVRQVLIGLRGAQRAMATLPRVYISRKVPPQGLDILRKSAQ